MGCVEERANGGAMNSDVEVRGWVAERAIGGIGGESGVEGGGGVEEGGSDD